MNQQAVRNARDIMNGVPPVRAEDMPDPNTRKQLREAHGLSLPDLAELLAVPLESVEGFEAGSRSTDGFLGGLYRKFIAAATTTTGGPDAPA